jgi:hypothetical protein
MKSNQREIFFLFADYDMMFVEGSGENTLTKFATHS